MQLQYRNFTSLTAGMTAAVQSAVGAFVNLTPGSVILSTIEATATVGLWVQYLISLVLQVTRLSTSIGPDVDTFVQDFGLSRLSAIAATGAVTFSRFTPTTSAVVPIGAQVLTLDGTQLFNVTLDNTNPAYNSGAGGYVLGVGTASVTVPVAAVNAGTQGNVQAGFITLLGTAISGIDSVVNALAFTNGLDAESDDALRARFQLYIQSRTEGTNLAVLSAIAGVQQGLTAGISENDPRPGNFIVTIDDGTGHPSTTLLNAVQAAITPVRPLNSTFWVQGPSILGASISITLTTAPGVDHNAVAAKVNTSVTAYVNSLQVGASLPYTKLSAIVYGTDATITNAAIILNASNVDLVPNGITVVRIVSLAVA